MIIKKFTIKNFRSYYGTKTFRFSDGLNLILGANGDGKTTFFDALDWLYKSQTSTRNADLALLVSAKFFEELPLGAEGRVMVSAVMKHKGHQYDLEKSFLVKKGLDSKMIISDFQFSGNKTNAAMTRRVGIASEMLENEQLFPSVIKKYCLFKGESELNIFKDKETLKTLINIFSDVKDFGPYLSFAKYAADQASQAQTQAITKKNANQKKLIDYQQQKSEAQVRLRSCQSQIEDYRQTVEDSTHWLKEYENNADTIKAVAAYQDQIKEIESIRDSRARNLDERYSIKLLDDYWILYGFSPILDEFYKKMNSYSEAKQQMLEERQLEIAQIKANEKADKQALEKLAKKLSTLPWYIPDVHKLKQIVDSKHCPLCDRDAEEGSHALDYMKQRLEMALKLDSNIDSSSDQIRNLPRLFEHDFIKELHEISIGLRMNNDRIRHIDRVVRNTFDENQKILDFIEEKNKKIREINNAISNLLAQSNTTEDLSNFHSLVAKIQNWMDDRTDAAEQIGALETLIPQIQEEIDSIDGKIRKLANTPEGQMFGNIYNFLHVFSQAIKQAEEDTYKDFLLSLEEKANYYLSLLNVDDFTGIVRLTKEGNYVTPFLYDETNICLSDANTSLKVTMHIAVLLAISELTKEEISNEYPLIFDAPTSDFDPGKDRDFYETLNKKVHKQCIAITKSYLDRDDASGEFYINKEQLSKIDCTVYRIHKKKGFEKKRLSTIETEVIPIKN